MRGWVADGGKWILICFFGLGFTQDWTQPLTLVTVSVKAKYGNAYSPTVYVGERVRERAPARRRSSTSTRNSAPPSSPVAVHAEARPHRHSAFF